MSERDDGLKTNQEDNIFKWIGKFFKGGAADKYNMIQQKIQSLLQTPAKILTGLFSKVDETMYEIVFGKGEDDETKVSFFSTMLSTIKNQFASMTDFISNKIFKPLGEKVSAFTDWLGDKVFSPIKEALIGEKGIITEFKNSGFYKSLKMNFTKMGNYFLGSPNGENGKRQGGLLSNTANSLFDMFDGAKYYFTGKGYTNRAGVKFANNNESVFGNLKSMFKGFQSSMKEYLFGKKSEGDEGKKTGGVLSGILNSIKDGFNNFSEAIFGPKSMRGKYDSSFNAITKKIKERAPKSTATGIIGGGAGLLMGGKLGLLGS
jgi:hypothetical protein